MFVFLFKVKIMSSFVVFLLFICVVVFTTSGTVLSAVSSSDSRCKLVKVLQTIDERKTDPSCKPKKVLTSVCKGLCPSNSKPYSGGGFNEECLCCSEKSFVDEKVTFHGCQHYIVRKEIKSCGCSKCLRKKSYSG